MLRSCLPYVVALMFACPPFALATKVKVWHQHTPAHYDKAQLKQMVVSSEGVLRLSRQLRPLAGLDASHVWDMVEDRDGNLYVATGNEGKIYKLPPEGKPVVVYASEQSQVLCLAVGSDGSIYAGTGPNGQIVRIDPRGQGKVFSETGEAYVWSLAVDPKGQTLYAGTGPHGRIYRINGEGKAAVFYTTRQEHILCVAAGGDGMVYAGTDKGGLVYRIDPRGKGFVLYQANQAEVRTLKVTPQAVYVGTSSPTSRRRGGGGGLSSRGTAVGVRDTDSAEVVSDKKAKTDKKETATSKKSATSGHEGSKSNSAPAPSTPASGENSVYRIALDGTVREVFREKAMVLSLLRQGERFFVGTGMDGQLFEVNEATRERSEIARLDHGQILCMCQRRDGSIVLGTGDPGKLYVLQDKYAARGMVLSEVLDAKIISRWGSLRWEGDTPAGTSVRIAARSGNVAEPDDTWSDWSAEQSDAEQATIAAPTARFLQYRVTLVTNNPARSPAVRGVTLRYMTTNQTPEITKVEAPDLNAVNLDNPKKLKFKWSATDANEDDLTYRILVRKDGWKNWIELEDDLDKTDFEWDTTTTPSGVYRVKVVASDRKDNPEGEALTGERSSLPFVVCHEAPAVTVKTAGIDGDQVILAATARSPLVRLTAASFAVNGKKWINVFPSDGLFDSKAETFQFKTEGLKPGTYVLVLRVRDAAGNTGSADVVFNVQPRAAK
ncbi:MAG TPA: two-component regulator propeller domain-containing protein [Gemmataceae bacterium]|nr:two-component regulator propeller domain-containing protein [Gemmataceae bacterium]